MLKQYKGKDLADIAKSKLMADEYYASAKYDGNYCQIEKFGTEVKFFTSGGKQFYDFTKGEELSKLPYDFIIEAEYIADTNGLLGDRGRCTLTTARTNFSKGLKWNGGSYMVFDILYFRDEKRLSEEANPGEFRHRLRYLQILRLPKDMQLVNFRLLTIAQAKDWMEEITAVGVEGVFLKHPTHKYRDIGRSNLAVKLKPNHQIDLTCIGIVEGEGKYIGMIGSLILQDSQGRIVNVGSGLTDMDRARPKEFFIGQRIPITYERIDNTYIQPRITK